MCGIYCSIAVEYPPSDSDTAFEKLLKQRGPDYYGRVDHTFRIQRQDGEWVTLYITLATSVLALRTEEDRLPVKQPLNLEGERGVLCWNGEAWTYDSEIITGSDTRFVAQRLSRVSSDNCSFHHDTMDVLSKVRGPFAFIYWNRATDTIYFGRDCVGRRSLLRTIARDGMIVLASVADFSVADTWEEVDADGIYTIDLKRLTRSAHNDLERCISRTPYSNSRINGEKSIPVPWSPLSTITPELKIVRRLHSKSPTVSSLLDTLRNAVQLRLPYRKQPNHPPIAILFSGGLDCTLIARLIHDALDKSARIDLLNVAFENPRIHKSADLPASAYEACPDRFTARQSLKELQKVCPAREWNLVCIDVPYTEFSTHKAEVRKLIHPHDTEMDLSIAMALYFAARGPTSAKVLFSGLGADELFGGYQRHAIAFKRGGYQALLAELQLDTERLGKRNLGRDDRVTARWGREVRYPFLDEGVISWAMDAKIEEKVGFGFEPSEGEESVGLDDKLVLRLVAKVLDMEIVAEEKKRAIQFGSRSAKMESGRVKGTEKVS